MQTYYYNQLTPEQKAGLSKRPSIDLGSAKAIAQKIIDSIISDSDKAVRAATAEFDGVTISETAVTEAEIAASASTLEKPLKIALEQAKANIQSFYSEQKLERFEKETMQGVVCFSEPRAIEKVGLYIPGGSAVLPSTVLMLGVPALLAGCSQVVLCTPPDKNGNIEPSILYAAQLCGISEIYKVGGAQAIAALAYGTETIPKVDKIFGPGNQYVSAAKMLVSIDPAGAQIDMVAGPSEVLVIADDEARSDFIAADLLAQAEHGPDSQVVLVSDSSSKVESVLTEVKSQLRSLPRREIAEIALENSLAIITESIEKAFEFTNEYAPEHLIINTKDAENYVNKVQNAGSVFIGQYSPESAGDYASGTNHSLPTSGYAKATSGISVASFCKQITFQKLTESGARLIGPTVATIAAAEGLDAHKRAMEIRYV